jgi:hypothetical protein
MRPKLVYDVLRQSSPRKMAGKNSLPPNRYNLLTRDSSPADSVRSNLSVRSRSISVKRKNSSDGSGSQHLSQAPESYASICGTSSQSPADDQETELVNEEIAKVSSICDKVSGEISKQEVDPALISIFSGILDAMAGIVKTQTMLNNKKSQTSTSASTQVPQPQTKRSKPDSSGLVFTDLSIFKKASAPGPKPSGNSESDPSLKKFKDTVKEAEKSVLIFNLNLGRAPIMNQDTMSTRTTMALTQRAAEVEKATGKIPSEDTQDCLDDVLSSVTGMKFFGKSTKSYSKAGDPDSGSYCTVPVKYEFADKDAKQFAESVLKDKCKVQCSTPYPAILREAIKQVINEVKREHSNHFVKVNIDLGSMTLKPSIRPLVDPKSKDPKVWSRLDPIPIPLAALDVSARKVPDDFSIDFKCCKVSTVENMEEAPVITPPTPTTTGNKGRSPRKS